MKNLTNQLVLITGAGKGIGRLMALRFSEEGSRLVLWDIDEDSVAGVAREIQDAGGVAWFHRCDVTDRELVYALAEAVKSNIGKVDVLVNNAGVVSGRPFLECTDEQLRRTMEVNIIAHFWTVKAFLPAMLEDDHGHIVTISSAAGLTGAPYLVDYSASKFAAVGFDEALRLELKKMGSSVKTTCVCPFFINTGMFEGVDPGPSLKILDKEPVAREIVTAVKKDKAFLKVPPDYGMTPVIRLLPTSVYDWLLHVIGVSSSMDGFKGRVD